MTSLEEEGFEIALEIVFSFSGTGLAISSSKGSLFQTRIRFLSHYISKETITPIERSLVFVDKFPDKILDKTQLQRFLGSLNYVIDFCPNINRISKPLHDRLKKNPVA